jgi:hypothetical protein
MISAVEVKEDRDQLLRTGDGLSRTVLNHLLAARDAWEELNILALRVENPWVNVQRVEAIQAQAQELVGDAATVLTIWSIQD